jgi:hypothetical protein
MQGFFYNQYPAPNITNFDQRGTNTGANINQQLWYVISTAPIRVSCLSSVTLLSNAVRNNSHLSLEIQSMLPG